MNLGHSQRELKSWFPSHYVDISENGYFSYNIIKYYIDSCFYNNILFNCASHGKIVGFYSHHVSLFSSRDFSICLFRSGATPLLDEEVPSIPVKEKPLIDLTADPSSIYDVPRLTHLDDEMREDEEGSLPVRVCSETDLTSPVRNDFILTTSGGGSVDDLEKSSEKENSDAGIKRGSRLRGPVISVTTTQKDVKTRQSRFEDMELLDLIGERDRDREMEGMPLFDL